jgi:ATP-dependent 26S proteasome regulatory subunit
VALAADAQRSIRDILRQFLELGPVFARNGVPNPRGLLLFGPPGNGKTLIGRILASTTRATFMYVTAADADNLDALRDGFALARRLKPTIVFLEDLDLYATDRRSGPDCRTLGEILNSAAVLRVSLGIQTTPLWFVERPREDGTALESPEVSRQVG